MSNRRRGAAVSVIDATLAEDAPKVVEAATRLPYFFDMMWDAKLGADLEGLRGNPAIRAALAQYGFDAAAWVKEGK